MIIYLSLKDENAFFAVNKSFTIMSMDGLILKKIAMVVYEIKKVL
jgi:hypothetical protein